MTQKEGLSWDLAALWSAELGGSKDSGQEDSTRRTLPRTDSDAGGESGASLCPGSHGRDQRESPHVSPPPTGSKLGNLLQLGCQGEGSLSSQQAQERAPDYTDM